MGGPRRKLTLSWSRTPGWLLPAVTVGCGCMSLLLARSWLADGLALGDTRYAIHPSMARVAHEEAQQMCGLRQDNALELMFAKDENALELRNLLDGGHYTEYFAELFRPRLVAQRSDC